jgi:hypothetical protein
MAIPLVVTRICLKENSLPQQRVQSLHGEDGQTRWSHSLEQVVTYIRQHLFYYYILKDGRAINIVLAETPDGQPFLKAETDNEIPSSLLQLPLFAANPPQTSSVHA